jgi:hypothetical protein
MVVLLGSPVNGMTYDPGLFAFSWCQLELESVWRIAQVLKG